MPSAYDLAPVKITHDPNQRIDTYAGKLPELDPLLIIEQWGKFLTDIGFKVIKDLTGIDLSGIPQFLNFIFEASGLDLPGLADLNPVTLLKRLVAAFEGIDLDAPAAILTAIFDHIGDVLGLDDIRDFLNDLFNGKSVESNKYPPYAIPFTPGAAGMSDAQRFIANLKAFLSFDFLSLDFNPVAAVQHFLESVLKPSGLADMIKQPLTDLVNILVDVLDSIPFIGPPLGNALEDLANMFGLLKTRTDAAQGTGDVAQKSADSANVGVALLIAKGNAEGVPGGVLIHDTFDRVGTTMGPDYVTHYFESGGGSWRTANDNLHWVGADANPRTVHSRRVETLATDYQSGQIVQDAIVKGTNVQDRTLIILLRQNAAQTRSVLATIRGGTVEIGCWVDGTYTRFGAVATVPNAAGDRWELWAGTLANVREFVLFRNGNEALRRTDTGALSYYGSDYRYPGPGARAGVNYTGVPPFATYSQASPPDIQSFDASDRVAA